MSDAVVIQTTTKSAEEAQRIASVLIQERLIGCAQICGPITSVFRWQGNVEQEQEYIVALKTTSHLVTKIEQMITEHHSYDVPEIITTKLEHVAPAYLQWLQSEVVTE